MGYIKSTDYPGWIYDDAFEDYISPSGRIASTPGAPFKGQVSKEDLIVIKKWADEDEADKAVEYIKPTSETTEVATIQGYEVELVKTIKIGDVTINIYRG